jgi:hypothetical protein
MKTKIVYTLAVLSFVASPAAAQLKVTSPSVAATPVTAANDFPTRAFQDPWDMSQRTDLGWWLWGTDNPGAGSNWTNPQIANGHFTATTAIPSPRLFLLDTPQPPTGAAAATPIGKTGQQYPIDASTYKHLVFRMSSSTGFFGGALDNASLFVWSTDTIFDGQTIGLENAKTANVTANLQGFAIYDVTLPNLGHFAQSGTDTPWSGLIRALQFTPTQHVGAAIDIDWIRLVDDTSATLHKLITWSGASGSVDVYLDNDNDPANGTLGRVCYNQSSTGGNGSCSFFVGALPAGDYYFAVMPTQTSQGTPSAASYSTGFYRVNDIPTIQFTTPSEEGSNEDFATVKLGNAWDFTSMSDIDSTCSCFPGKVNVNNDGITSLTLTDEAGNNLGPQTVYLGTSAPAAAGNVGDPQIYTMFWDGKGKTTQIDPSRYRILTIDSGLPNLARSLPGGSIGRVIWRAMNEPVISADGAKAREVSNFWIVDNVFGENTMNRISIDMNKMPVDPSSDDQSTTWSSSVAAGGIDGFRFDPHEFSAPTNFFIKRIKLASLERSSRNTAAMQDSFTFKFTTSKAGTVTLFLDQDANKTFNAGSSIVVSGGIAATAGANTFTWTVPAGTVPAGEYNVWAKIDDSKNQNFVYARTGLVVDPANALTGIPTFDHNVLNFATLGQVARTSAQTVRMTFTGAGDQCWSSSSSLPGFVTVSPANGVGAASLSIGIAGNFPGGTTPASITISPCLNGSNARPISVSVNALFSSGAPTGFVDTPANNSTAIGSVAVTGWADDDIEVTGVSVCRDPLPGETTPLAGQCGGQAVFIGDATFINDARPDVQGANPTLPYNYRAGWGYLMLTNFLPNQGNGAITLRVYARDADGHITLIGGPVINTQNNAATKPFGAIDTPTQGQVICGSSFINFGWALTQSPKDVPADSSTITVFIDNVAVGHPGTRASRGDITAAFPQLDTSHAVGGFFFDTTSFANGLHTIAWSVTDSGGQSDGVGSRFFSILNPCTGG